MYSIEYMETRDIDCFAILNFDGKQIPIHFASRGNHLPREINKKSNNRAIQTWTAKKGGDLTQITSLPENVEVVGNNCSWEENYEYLLTFCYMARLGFYSYDCIGIEGSKLVLQLVVKPKEGYNPLKGCEVLDNLQRQSIEYFGEGGVEIIRI